MKRRELVTAAAFVALSAGAAEPPGHEADPSQPGVGMYRDHCAACHGLKGEGAPDWKRPNAHGELPAPPHDSAGHTWRHPDAMLRRMIADGWRDPFNKTSRLTMPAFKTILTTEEIDAVIEYLKSLWAPEQRLFQANLSRPAS